MIFNSVRSFVESVGRTRTSTQGQLDQMLVKWTGPTRLADSQAPGVGSYHSVFTAMQAQTVRKIGEVAGITTLEVEYRGKFNGQKVPTFGNVTIEVGASEGEIEYTRPFAMIAQSTGTPSAPSALFKVGLRTLVRRFVGLSTTYHYTLNPKPAQKPSGPLFGAGLGPEFTSSQDRFAGESSVTYVSNPEPAFLDFLRGSGTSIPVADLYCSGYSAVPTSQDWYQVTETWSSRYISQAIEALT
jgi:hypothetical protein